MTRRWKSAWMGVVALGGFAVAVSASAGPLHAFCYGSTPSCTDNGTVTPTSDTSPNFGFWISKGPTSGLFAVAVLVPNNYAAASSYTINGTIGGDPTTARSFVAYKNSGTWTSGTLQNFLGFSASPNNPLSAWLGSTQSVDSGATGYNVYFTFLGPVTLEPKKGRMTGPLLSIGDLQLGSVVAGFLSVPNPRTEGVDISATAPSGALFEDGGTPPVATPEPGALVLFAAGLAGLGWALSRRRQRA
ncbi:MAG: PEP-CTERM sorting domain-containing protein [Pseudomonadota bacterium]|nr:PEP-CTERM sorting domain-containing protein [Pseudomonadota bacterium]